MFSTEKEKAMAWAIGEVLDRLQELKLVSGFVEGAFPEGHRNHSVAQTRLEAVNQLESELWEIMVDLVNGDYQFTEP